VQLQLHIDACSVDWYGVDPCSTQIDSRDLQDVARNHGGTLVPKAFKYFPVFPEHIVDGLCGQVCNSVLFVIGQSSAII
jgi:hypothetical protein